MTLRHEITELRKSLRQVGDAMAAMTARTRAAVADAKPAVPPNPLVLMTREQTNSRRGFVEWHPEHTPNLHIRQIRVAPAMGGPTYEPFQIYVSHRLVFEAPVCAVLAPQPLRLEEIRATQLKHLIIETPRPHFLIYLWGYSEQEGARPVVFTHVPFCGAPTSTWRHGVYRTDPFGTEWRGTP